MGGALHAMALAIRRGPAFIQDAIAMAKRNGYDGYSWDHELHCKQNAQPDSGWL